MSIVVDVFLCIFLLASTLAVLAVGFRVLVLTMFDLQRLPPSFWEDD